MYAVLQHFPYNILYAKYTHPQSWVRFQSKEKRFAIAFCKAQFPCLLNLFRQLENGEMGVSDFNMLPSNDD